MDYLLRSRRLRSRALMTGLIVISVAAGTARAHAISIPVTHVGVAWGDNGYGELGNGGETNSPSYVGDGLKNVVQISAGNTDTLALLADGTVDAWGFNYTGQLGTGGTASSATPVPVAGLSGITQVAAGWQHSLALRSDGTVWSWGSNLAGQLGDGTTTLRLTPVQVTGLTGVVQIAAGNQWSLALRSDGTVWAWGSNGYGQLGNSSTYSDVPVQVPGLALVTSIAAGAGFGMAVEQRKAWTMGILTTIMTWGQDTLGQLGNGSQSSSADAVPRIVFGVSVPGVQEITAGQQSALVLGTDGSVWGWGNDDAGQLANGVQAVETKPVESVAPGSGITQISAGANHLLALLSGGTVEAWGEDESGQLGNGAFSGFSLTPVQVTGLTGVIAVSAGGNTSQAIRSVILIDR
jgi:alpha-tubulin suppressor-like RCC1 family protein